MAATSPGSTSGKPVESIVFVSSTSTDLRACRTLTCEILSKAGHDSRSQEDFQHGSRSLEDFLADRVSACRAVICLVGFELGAEPKDRDERRSYTQLEYHDARDLGLPVFVFFSSDGFVPDAPSKQDASAATLQRVHREALKRAHIWRTFSSKSELREHVVEFARQLPGILPLDLHKVHPPSRPKYFHGRSKELKELTRAVRKKTPSLIAVVGMAGQGKSTLLDRWLRDQPRNDWVRGAWFSLDGGLSESRVTFDRFLDDALGHFIDGEYDKREVPDVATRVEMLLDAVRERPTLLVLDALERWLSGWEAGGEHGVDTLDMRTGVVPELDYFLRQAATMSNGSHVVLSSRALPAALDDVECAIVPVRDETKFDATLDGLDDEAAVQLLHDYSISGSEEELSEVAQRYGRHPLALTVLGGLLRAHFGGLLDKHPAVDPVDSRGNLRTLLETTAQHLPAGERSRRFLSVAAQALEDPSLSAIAASMSEDLEDEGELRHLAVTLSDWQLLNWDGARQTVKMHALVRRHFGDLLDPDEARTIHRRLSCWYEALALPPAPTSLEEAAPRLLAIEHALRAGEIQSCVRLIFSPLAKGQHLLDWASAWGHHTTAIELLRRVADTQEGSARAMLLAPSAALIRQLGKLEDALAELNAAVTLLEPDPGTALPHELLAYAGALMNRGNALRQLSRPNDAIPDFEVAMRALEQLPTNDPERARHLPGARMDYGITLRELGRLRDAEIECRQAVLEYQEQIDADQPVPKSLLARAWTNHGILLEDLEHHDQALEAFAEASSIYQQAVENGQREFEPELARVRVSCAGCMTEARDGERALAELTPAIEGLRAMVDEGRADLDVPLAHAYLGRSQASLLLLDTTGAADDSNLAVLAYESAINRGRVDLHSWLAMALANRAQASFLLGDESAAQSDLDRSLGIFSKRIELGEAETRVMYLRKCVAAADYLAGHETERAKLILERGVRELEQGLSDDLTVEALVLEARRSLRELDRSESDVSFAADLLARLERCASRRISVPR